MEALLPAECGSQSAEAAAFGRVASSRGAELPGAGAEALPRAPPEAERGRLRGGQDEGEAPVTHSQAWPGARVPRVRAPTPGALRTRRAGPPPISRPRASSRCRCSSHPQAVPLAARRGATSAPRSPSPRGSRSPPSRPAPSGWHRDGAAAEQLGQAARPHPDPSGRSPPVHRTRPGRRTAAPAEAVQRVARPQRRRPPSRPRPRRGCPPPRHPRPAPTNLARQAPPRADTPRPGRPRHGTGHSSSGPTSGVSRRDTPAPGAWSSSSTISLEPARRTGAGT
jgi:hypothetical protein